MSTPLATAAYLVRDCLDTLIQRHERTQTDAVSREVIALAMSLLEHLDADVKQMRADK